MAGSAACRDCAQCTGNSFTGKGRDFGRATATALTFGVAKMVRKTCSGCGHPMSEHRGRNAEAMIVQQEVAPVRPRAQQGPPSLPPGWYSDPVDRRAQTWWDGTRWLPETKHFP